MAWWEYTPTSHWGSEDYDDYDDAFDEGHFSGPLMITCRSCGMKDLKWGQHNGKWRLFAGSTLHVCEHYQKQIPPEPKKETIGLTGTISEDELDNCPFCFSHNVDIEEVYTEPDVGWQRRIYAVHCFNCGARGSTVYDTKMAIEKWNDA